MTETEVRTKSEEKIKQVQDLAKSLKVRIVAQQALTQGNIIKSVIYFIDEEEYDIEKPPVVERGPSSSTEQGGKMKVHISQIEKKDA